MKTKNENNAVEVNVELNKLRADVARKQAALAWAMTGATGASSKTLVCTMEGIKIASPYAPGDGIDWERCHLLLQEVPEYRARIHEMAAVSPAWAAIAAAWEDLETVYKVSVPYNQLIAVRAVGLLISQLD